MDEFLEEGGSIGRYERIGGLLFFFVEVQSVPGIQNSSSSYVETHGRIFFLVDMVSHVVTLKIALRVG